MQIKIKKLDSKAIIPDYALPGDAGLDLYSLEDYEIKPGEKKVFALGFALEFPDNFVAVVKDKGGMANKCLHTMGGVVDSGYRGEYMIQLINLGSTPYKVEKNDKIAQLLILPVITAELIEVDELSETDRGHGRFGSTGR
ncbi:MAG: dUTP diphosphatase [bacterium]